jgi:hypothetical protein
VSDATSEWNAIVKRSGENLGREQEKSHHIILCVALRKCDESIREDKRADLIRDQFASIEPFDTQVHPLIACSAQVRELLPCEIRIAFCQGAHPKHVEVRDESIIAMKRHVAP